MKKHLIWLLALATACSTQPTEETAKEPEIKPEPPYVERLDPLMDELIPAGAQIETLASGFTWSEGPLWLADQNALIFSDVPENVVWKWTEEDSLSEYLRPSGYQGDEENKREPGSNGLAIDLDGNLILCQHGNRQLARMNTSVAEPAVDYSPIADNYQGKRFNSPNDVCVRSNGDFYFTDPPYGLDEWNTKEIDFQGVYRVDSEGNVTLQVDTLARPNGIALSPDEKTLYVAQSDPDQARYYAFDLDENGNVVSGKVLLDVTGLGKSGRRGLPDGLKVHSSGNLFATGPGGVLVITPEGKHIGTIMTGQGTANCGFNDDESVLFMTADMFLMRIALK